MRFYLNLYFRIIHGRAPLFWGANKFGWWAGANIIPSKFGFYLDWTYREKHV